MFAWWYGFTLMLSLKIIFRPPVTSGGSKRMHRTAELVEIGARRLTGYTI